MTNIGEIDPAGVVPLKCDRRDPPSALSPTRVNRRRPRYAIVLLLGLAGISASSAHASTILGAGPGYAQPSQTSIGCWVNNAGTKPVTIFSMTIYHENAGPIVPGYECKGTLSALRSCYTYARIANDAAYACKVVVSDPTNIRGHLEITDNQATVLYAEPLR
jgi:hypothetical protein